MRSMVPGSFGFTATRLRGVSVPEISSADSIVPTEALTTETSTTVAARRRGLRRGFRRGRRRIAAGQELTRSVKTTMEPITANRDR